ncbi:unnamed protein product, partial [Didymodactylos carnosus]
WTALHYACQKGHVEIVKYLINYGAIMMKDNMELTPLMIAALELKDLVVEYFMNNLNLEYIEALELLAISYCCHDDLEKTYNYLLKSLQLRYFDFTKPILKNILLPLEVYEYHIESQTIDELNKIHSNSNALYLEILVICERLLGVTSSTTLDSILYIGYVYRREKKYDRCIALWLRALNLKKMNGKSVNRDLKRFVKLFNEMRIFNVNIEINIFVEIFQNIIEELISEQKNNNVQSCWLILYLIVIISKVIILKTQDEQRLISKLIYRINRLNFKVTGTDLTILHLCVNSTMPDMIKNIQFPCSSAAKLLMQNGANITAFDSDRNTPLHTIACSKSFSNDVSTIITDLIEHGAHIDLVNCRGKTPFDCARTEIQNLLKNKAKLSLKCLTAKYITKLNINYHNLLSMTLVDFIKNH